MRRYSWFAGFVAAIVAVSLIACNGDDNGETQDPDAGNGDVENDVNGEPDPVDNPDCDPLIESYCSMPWPSNQYLADDNERETGYTLTFGDTTLPQSRQGGEHISPEAFERLDGYGLGTPVAVLFPGVDVDRMPAEDSIEDSFEDDDREAFYFEVTDQGLEPVPFWAELDVHAEEPEEQILYLRPAVVLEEDTRYVVGFRNLVDEDGQDIERSEAFQQLVDGDTDDDDRLAERQERFDDIFELLDEADIDIDEVTLAWDFHTGSSDGLHGELLHVMDEGVEVADDEGIEMTIDSVDAHSEQEHDHIAYEIEGTFRVPHFLEEADRTNETSYLFDRDDEGMPAQNGWREADFWLQIPHTAVDGTPHGLVKYGHGMLGSGSQVSGSFNQQIAYENELVFYGADFIGFSDEDVPQAIAALQQPTYFEELVDRMHQGVLEYALLTMAMRDGLEGLVDDEKLEGEPLELAVDEDRIYYSGISQGGIYGVTALAVDPIIERGHLGVPGHNYSMMMERSSNFYDAYDFVLESGFPERLDQAMAMPIIQLLWDKIDPVSYVRRLTAEPFDEDRPKYGLFALAKGDYQVAVVTKEITARSGIDIPIMEPYDRERGTPWGVDTADYPHDGSGIVLYDFGNPWPEPGNHAPDDEYGDPHGLPRDLDEHNEQMMRFFDDEQLVDVCDGDYCHFPDQW